MPKWITVQVDDSTHSKLRTLASGESILLKDYVVSVLKQHAESKEVIVVDKKKDGKLR